MTQYQDLIESDSPTVVIGYTNWRGEYGEREIVPMRPWFGSTDWHPEAQWLLKAWDVEKDAERDFAIKDIGFMHSGGEEKNGVDHIADAGKMVGLKPLEWEAEIIPGHTAVHSLVVDGVLCRWWGEEPPKGVETLNAALTAALTNTDLPLRAENERLRNIIMDGEAAMWGTHERGFVMGPLIHRPNIGQIITDLKARATTAEAKLEEAAKVLEKFAAVADKHHSGYPDSEFAIKLIRVGELRAAKSFLANLKGAE